MSDIAPEPNHELITALILEASRLIENAAPEFALAWPAEAQDQQQRIDDLVELARTLTALAAAASTLHGCIAKFGWDIS